MPIHNTTQPDISHQDRHFKTPYEVRLACRENRLLKLQGFGDKLQKKIAYRHSNHPVGLTATTYAELLAKSPERAVEKAIKGMLPKNKLAAQQLSKLKVYAGPEHPHGANKPKTFEFNQVAQ